MDNYCTPYSEGELFPLLLIPVGLFIILIIIFVASKLHFIEFIRKSLAGINPFIFYFSGIPFVFILGYNAVYLSPNSISATGSEKIVDPVLRAIYVTGVFSILWPLLLVGGLVIDSLFIGIAVYYPFKDIICRNFFIPFTISFPIQFFSIIFSPFMLFFNAPLYYLLTVVLIKRIKHMHDLRLNTDLKQQ